MGVEMQLFECYGVEIQLFKCYGVEIQLFECYTKTPYKRCEGKTNDLLIAFIGYVNDTNKLQQFKVFY
jgi:hypothetical protein